MSAWYVWSALGLYPVDPVSKIYVLGSPLVERATIHLQPGYAPGREFRILAPDNSSTNIYVQSATLNGRPLTRAWLTHDELTAGGELVLQMGPQPNKTWAVPLSSN
jgi:putative alpha-1,2-mannosidase